MQHKNIFATILLLTFWLSLNAIKAEEMKNKSTTFSNHLANAKSPYLLQHV